MTRFLCLAALVAGVWSSACTRKNPDFCTSAADCADPSKPFCDVDGTFGALANSCIATPLDGGSVADAGACTPGAALSCTADTLTTCSADGHSAATTACALGCATSGPTRCLTFTPSNGLAPALAMAGSAADVILPAGAKINTDLGLVEKADGTPISITSQLVNQSGGAPIRVFIASSFVLDQMTIQGTENVAFVALGQISVIGHIDASATGAISGPGAVTGSASCDGQSIRAGSGIGSPYPAGAGGAGNATPGGDGGETGGTAGAAETAFTPLSGGCVGGDQLFFDGTLDKRGGGGGGGIQMVSLTSISFTASGQIDVGGGGGAAHAGGGAGGTVVLEAPAIVFEGAGTGITANGGAGGACDMSGADGAPSATPASAPRCTPRSGGDGGTGTTPAAPGENCTQSCILSNEGGGGGAAGRLRVSTRDGAFSAVAMPLLSVAITRVTLTAE